MKKNIGSIFSLILIGGIIASLYFIFNIEQEKKYRTLLLDNKVAVFMVDGNVYSRTAIIDGKMEYFPDNPEKDHYVFEYWELEGKKFSNSTKLKDDITLTAVFKKENNDNKNNGNNNSGNSNNKQISDTTKVENIKLDKNIIKINIGHGEKINGEILPSNATNKKITWISNNSTIATVDDNGQVKGVGIGTTWIIARSSNGKESKCEVTVSGNNINASKISIDKKNTSINVGDSITLNPIITPENTTNKVVTWQSSNNDIATVSTNGVVKGLKKGSVTITVKTSNGKQDQSTVTIYDKKIDVSKIDINITNKNIEVGDSFKITSTITPNNATNKNVTWQSSNDKVAIVDQNGSVKGVGPGSATLTAITHNGKGAECHLTVTGKIIAVSSITLNSNNLSMFEGDKTTLKATINPSNSTNKNIKWISSSSKIATVDQNGAVVAVGVGTTTITATIEGKSSSCTVKVSAKTVAVTAVVLNKINASMYVGDNIQLMGTVSPSNATNKSISWRSSNTSIATVDASGKVTAKSPGTAKIIITSSNGKSAECTITVNKKVTTTPTPNPVKTPSPSNGISKIHFMNVGSSDATIIESNGHFGLVDTSNPYNDNTPQSSATPNKTESVEHVIDYLSRLIGCSGTNCKGKLDFVVATHSHSDHIGGVPRIASVFANSNTKYYYRSYVKTTDDSVHPDWDNMGYHNRAVNAMKSSGAQMIEITNKDITFNFYDYTIKLMNTESVSSDELSNNLANGENKNAVIEMITHKNGKKVLLASDMEMQDENRMKNKIGKVDALKFGHHGYSTSSSNDFIGTLKPSVSIISNNMISLNASVFGMCYALYNGTNIYMTGNSQDAIVMTFSNNGYTILNSNGSSMKTSNFCSSSKVGWQQIKLPSEKENVWIYIDSNHKISTGWKKIDNLWYYFDESGIMATGWRETYWEGKKCWYHIDNDGHYDTGWKQITWSKGTNWFYFESDGCMLQNTSRTINGKHYSFDSDGVCTGPDC